MNEENLDAPLTKRDLAHFLAEMRAWILEREAALMWKVIALQITLVAAIAGAQWAAITWAMAHWKP